MNSRSRVSQTGCRAGVDPVRPEGLQAALHFIPGGPAAWLRRAARAASGAGWRWTVPSVRMAEPWVRTPAAGGGSGPGWWFNRAHGAGGSQTFGQADSNPGDLAAHWAAFMSFQMSGVRISCIARSSLPPGTTMVLARDMKLRGSCSAGREVDPAGCGSG